MKLLFFEWNALMQKDIENVLKTLPEIKVEYISYEFRSVDSDSVFMQRFPAILAAGDYDIVFSVNFFPLVSDVCQSQNIPYVSWVYDAPMNVRKISSFANSVNTIHVFDGGEYEDLLAMGANVYHTPLGVDTGKISSMQITDEDRQRFEGAVAFVGQLYSSNYDAICSSLPDYTISRLENIIQGQYDMYNNYIIRYRMSDELMLELNTIYRQAPDSPIRSIEPSQLEFVLACEVTRRERINALRSISRQNPVSLYSYDTVSECPGVINKGIVKYYSEMPKVFCLSKINLNISLKSIRTGMPLRILDILGAGGFLITNYQEDLDHYYTNGRDLIMYKSIDQLPDIIDYYLSHEAERQAIAANGYGRTRQLFELKDQLVRILEV